MNESVTPIQSDEIKITSHDQEIDDFLTSKEVANILRTTLTALCRWRKIGYGPEYLKCGGYFKYSRKKLIKFIEENTNKKQ